MANSTAGQGQRPRGGLVKARRVAVPPAARLAGAFTQGADYEVAFAVERPRGTAMPAEQWARAMWEEAPRAMRWFLIVGWLGITLRIRPRRSPGRILGWPIEGASPDTVVLAVTAWVGMTSCNVISVDAGRVTLSSFVRCVGPLKPVARVVWAVTRPIHEAVLPALMNGAVRRPAGTAGGRR